MEPVAAIERHFAYEEWANERTLQTLRSLAVIDPDLIGAFAHILSGKRIWLDRIEGTESESPGGWPNLTLEECESRNAKVNDSFRAFIGHLRAEELDRTISFPWSKGDLKTPLREVLSHLITHGMYHRGEIMAGAGQTGAKVPSTDYVIWWNKTQQQD
jgi:uncharacterized damage-inducible protein DinB